jgi:hypothetical protein
MGHSCIEYRGKSDFLNDHDLVIVISAVARQIERMDGGKYRRFLAGWNEQLEMSISGGIDPQLDEHFASPADRETLLDALTRARSEILARGDTIPGDELTSMVGMPENFRFVDRSASDLAARVDRVIRFVREG